MCIFHISWAISGVTAVYRFSFASNVDWSLLFENSI